MLFSLIICRDFHCGLIGYNQKKKNRPVPEPPQQSLLLDSCLEESALRNHCSTNIDSTSHVSAKRPEKSTDYGQIESQQGIVQIWRPNP